MLKTEKMKLTNFKKIISLIMLFFIFQSCASKEKKEFKQMSQFPSPMVENTRAHERIAKVKLPGTIIKLNKILSKPIQIYFPDYIIDFSNVDLLIHFHGASYIPEYSVYKTGQPIVAAVVNLGSGSSVYELEFLDNPNFKNLISKIVDTLSFLKSAEVKISHFYLSSFSAGYGAVRAILKNYQSMIDGIILLDGLHTDYEPERKVLSDGGKLNEDKLNVFLTFAKLAVDNKKKFLFTHSEIFPGTYASTTETSDWLINSLVLKSHVVLKWGPGGMQQLSETIKNGLTILGFAGNTAPDHVDHLHNLPEFLKIFLDLQ